MPTEYSVIALLLKGSILPIRLRPGMVNQMKLSGPTVIPAGCAVVPSSSGKRVKIPELGLKRLMRSLPLSVIHKLSSGPLTIPAGPLSVTFKISVTLPVPASTRPSLPVPRSVK